MGKERERRGDVTHQIAGMIDGEVRIASVPEWLILESGVSPEAIRLYALLAFYVNQTAPSRGDIREAIHLDEDQILNARKELISVGAISVRELADCQHYTVRLVPAPPVPEAAPPQRGADRDDVPLRAEYNYVVEHWKNLAPPLTAHREAYYKDSKARYAANKALDRHGLNDVTEAMDNYAHVLSNPTLFYWTHRYGFCEFLNKPGSTPGVDHFVSSALPFRNFKRKDDTLSAEEIFNTFIKEGADD